MLYVMHLLICLSIEIESRCLVQGDLELMTLLPLLLKRALWVCASIPDLHNSSIPYCIHDAPVFKKSYCLSLLALRVINSEAYEVDAKFSSTFSVFALVQVQGNDYPMY